MTVKVNNKGTSFVRVRLYGIGVDAIDAFRLDATLYEEHNTAKNASDLSYGTDVYSVLLDIPINTVQKHIDNKTIAVSKKFDKALAVQS